MTDKTTVIHHRIPIELAEFIDRMAETIEYHNKAHVTTVALQRLMENTEWHPVARNEAEDTCDHNLSALCDLVKQHS